MNQKRIAMFSYHTCPLASVEGKETGGMNVYVLELGKSLAAMGHQVDVFTRSQGDSNEKIVTVVPGFRVIHLVAGPQESIGKKLLLPYIPEFVSHFYEFMMSESGVYDCIHAHYYLSGLASLEVKKTLPGIPIIMTFHTLALMKNLVARNDREIEEKERIDAEFMLVRHVDKIVAPSDTDLQYLEFLYDVPEVKLTVIPPGVDTNIFLPMNKTQAKEHLGISKDHKIVLFVGRIEPLKGIDGLLYAMKIIVKKNPKLPVCLVIVGGDTSQDVALWKEPLKMLELLRRELSISAIVKFVGQRPQEELPYYYNAADVVVMPSHYESFGMAALEAMACGVPVIMTNVAGISSFLDERHKSLVSTVNNPLLLSSQIESLLINDKLHSQVSGEVLLNVQEFSWPHIATSLDLLYDEVLQAKKNI